MDNQDLNEDKRNALSEWEAKVEEAVADFAKSSGIPNSTYFAPSDEPLQWTELKTKLIRADVAVLAIHLVAARVAFKAFPAMQQIILAAFIGKSLKAGDDLAEKAARKELPGIGWVRALTAQIIGIVKDSIVQAQLEKTMRAECLGGMRAIRAHTMKHRNKHRKTKEVFSRHYSPKQRRINHAHS